MATPDEPANRSELRTFLIADVRGYTLFTHERGDEAAAKLAGRFADIARQVIETRGGSLIELRGDEALAVFGSARQAIRAAVDLQDGFVKETISDPALPLPVGIGLDAGEAVPLEGGYRGGALNLAARLCGQAGPGEILASREVVHLARKLDGVRYEDRGEISLKGLADPVRAVRIVSEAGDPRLLLKPLVRQPAAPRHRRWQPSRVLIAAGVVVVLLAAGVPLALQQRGVHLSALGANAIGEIDPSSNAILTSVAIGAGPSGIAFGAHSLWIANEFGDSVTRFDTTSQQVTEIPVGDAPVGVAFAAGAVWVANSDGGTVARISPVVNRVVDTIGVGNGPIALASGRDVVWLVNSLDGTVSGIDPSKDRVTGTFPVGARPSAIAVTDGAVWVANEADGTVSQLDPTTGDVLHEIHVGNGPKGIAIGFGSVWVTNWLDGTVFRIDPATGRVVATDPVGAGPRGIVAGNGAVWVANELGESLSRIDPTGGSITQTIRLGSRPLAISMAGGAPWVTTRASSEAHRGGTLRWFVGQWQQFDPAYSYAESSWAALSLTNDGLVTFERVGGSDGATIVPDLAVSVPTPTDGGRAYAFQMRPGITYSTGEAVRPSDIRYGIERLFEAPGGAISAAPYYRDIVGADACASHPNSPCDLSSGIETNDAADTITFHLRQPDPDFLYELTLPFADAVPPSVPSSDQTESPIPATGPYMAQESTDKELILVRNPQFHEWSAAAKPDGYPDRIEIVLKVDREEAVTRIEKGGDVGYVMNFVPADRLNEIRTRYPAQLHEYVAPSIETIVFNNRVPPFDDVRARKAVNFVLDRTRAVQVFGDPDTLDVTCQIMTPTLPGYDRYCPYTKDPRPSGVWTAPDLRRAHALVAESGTAGQAVTVWARGWNGAESATFRYVASALRELGYRVKLRLINDVDRYFGGIVDSRPEPQVFGFGWLADYPSASTFFNVLLSCASFRRGGSVGGFCDHAVDRKIHHALDLQLTDAAAAARAWEEIDRTVTKLAPWAPLFNDVGVDFVSARVGNYQHNPEFGRLPDQMWVR